MKDAERITSAQHVVDIALLARHIGKAVVDAVMFAQEIEGFADARQHAERQDVDLHQPKRIDVVLVPFDKGPLVHGGIADGHDIVEASARQNKAANMLREMTRKA